MPEIGAPANSNARRRFGSIKMPEENQLSREEIIKRATGQFDEDNAFTRKPKNQLDKDSFFKLLSFQMQNQNPLDPMKQEQYVADLARFSQLEQMTNVNKNIEEMRSLDRDAKKFYAASFIGKQVTSSGNTLNVISDGQDSDVFYKTNKPAARVLVNIRDDKNNIIRQFNEEQVRPGGHTLRWDGTQLDGSPAPKGIYNIEVLAFDADGSKRVLETMTTGTVESVSFDNGETVLTVDGKKVSLRDISAFSLGAKKNLTPVKQAMQKFKAGQELQ